MDITIKPKSEAISIDEIITKVLSYSPKFPDSCEKSCRELKQLQRRLELGAMRLAVLGQFNRGKSTFINALLGYNILPTSVIPTTSIPTIIRYGSTNRCTIKFFDNKKPFIVDTTVEHIRQTLCKYVTEENNSFNRLCVEEVILECNSNVLMHGTVLIDTPGFGSTHIHNTKTSLELLSNCDAACFILSAELPITQFEVEFLKEITKYVSRIFFILNKIDLLTENEIRRTELFIKSVLRKTLTLSIDIKLFPVCSRLALQAATAMSDGAEAKMQFEQSGLATIKTDIIDFLCRDKYYALSEALIEKLKNSILEIISELQKQYSDLISPLQSLTDKLKALELACSEIKKQKQLQIESINTEYETFKKYLKEQIESNKQIIVSELSNNLEEIIARAIKASVASTIIRGSFPIIVNEAFNRFAYKVATDLNDRLKKSALSYQKNFEKFHYVLSNSLKNTILPPLELTDNPLELITFSRPNFKDIEDVADSLVVSKFISNSKKLKMLRHRFNDALCRIFLENTSIVTETAEKQLNLFCKSLTTYIGKCYEELFEAVNKQSIELKTKLENMESSTQPLIKEILYLKNELNATLSLLN